MVKKRYLKYNIGDPKITAHIDAVHAQAPNADQFTGEIVEGVIEDINCSGIISTISRNIMDLNRPRSSENSAAIDEFRETIYEFLNHKKILDERNTLTKNYLHLAIHGMRDRKNDFELGTRNGNSCSPQIYSWFRTRIEELSKNIGIDHVFPGDVSKSYHRHGDQGSNYVGYGEKFHTIQIEINRTWRLHRRSEVILFLSKIIYDFDKQFNIN